MDSGFDIESDVIVIGAGMAGLTVSRELAREGLAVELLEARDWAGGRVITAHSPEHPFPIELGAEFVHGRPEPTVQLAREANVELVPLGDRHLIRRGGHFDDMAAVWQTLADLFHHANLSPADLSVAELLERTSVDPDMHQLCRDVVEGFEAAPSDELSVQSIAEDLSNAAEAPQYRVEGGYRALVSHLECAVHDAGVCVHLNCPVRRVDWSKPGCVRAYTVHGRCFEAPRCVVAVPLGVLEADPLRGGIAFEPALQQLTPAFLQVRPGHAHKIVMCFHDDVWHERWPAEADFLHLQGELFNTCWRQSQGSFHQLTVWAGGPKSLELGRQSEASRLDLALRSVALLLGESEAHVRAALVDWWQHDFNADPTARGAYSYVRRGGFSATQALREPLAEQLFFAGEATDHMYPGTVAGAIASGHRVAAQILHGAAPRRLALA
ncbi:MAG TPA: NAD(P)/FAD-dependent oxidoreductase [Polyangiaceae bacterium]|jgi:monoamine oxidase